MYIRTTRYFYRKTIYSHPRTIVFIRQMTRLLTFILLVCSVVRV